MNTGLYLQPSPLRNNDNSLPTAPDEGGDVYALINELTNRIDQATKKIEHKVDSNALAKILLTDRDIVLMGDQVSVVGQLNIVDWIRDISGNPTGGIDPRSMTRITGGKVQTGVIESFNWSTSTGSQFNLDTGTIVLGGTSSPKFSVSSAGVMTCVDAVVTGTLRAGSIIAGSVKLNNASGMSLDSLAAGANVQSALSAGVTNILGGIGSNFQLDVNVSNAFVALRHKDAVFLGTAAPGSVKPALGISATGIGIGYNRASDGAWVTSITLDASGNAAFAGTISAGSVITDSVTVGGVALSTISSNASSGKSISDALLVSGTSVLKGVLVPTAAGAIKTGTITWNATTGALTGGTGIAVTAWGIIGANAGTATFTLEASTGAATFKGDITGGSNIDITGQGKFGGNGMAGGYSAAILANNGKVSSNGIVSWTGANSGDSGVLGLATSANTYGIYGYASATGSKGVFGSALSSSAVGVTASNGVGGTALQVLGPMTINNSTLVTNLNADTVDGVHASALAKLSGGNTFSGDQTFSNNMTVTGLVRGGDFRTDQAAVTGTATATFPGNNKPGSTTTVKFVPFTVNGVFGHMAWWPNV